MFNEQIIRNVMAAESSKIFDLEYFEDKFTPEKTYKELLNWMKTDAYEVSENSRVDPPNAMVEVKYQEEQAPDRDIEEQLAYDIMKNNDRQNVNIDIKKMSENKIKHTITFDINFKGFIKDDPRDRPGHWIN